MPVFNAILVQWEIRSHWHLVIFPCNCVLRHVVLKVFAHKFFQKVENLAPPFLVKEQDFKRCSFHTKPWHNYHWQWTCGMFQTVGFGALLNFSSLWLSQYGIYILHSVPPFFWNCRCDSWGSNSFRGPFTVATRNNGVVDQYFLAVSILCHPQCNIRILWRSHSLHQVKHMI